MMDGNPFDLSRVEHLKQYEPLFVIVGQWRGGYYLEAYYDADIGNRVDMPVLFLPCETWQCALEEIESWDLELSEIATWGIG